MAAPRSRVPPEADGDARAPDDGSPDSDHERDAVAATLAEELRAIRALASHGRHGRGRGGPLLRCLKMIILD